MNKYVQNTNCFAMENLLDIISKRVVMFVVECPRAKFIRMFLSSSVV
jgi:hypothetical protein